MDTSRALRDKRYGHAPESRIDFTRGGEPEPDLRRPRGVRRPGPMLAVARISAGGIRGGGHGGGRGRRGRNTQPRTRVRASGNTDRYGTPALLLISQARHLRAVSIPLPF